jgi:hypothetical protein
MRAPRIATAGLVFVLAASAVVHAQATPTTAPPATAGDDPLPASPEQVTEAKGALPADLPGRWLVVGWIQLPDGKSRTTTALWDVIQRQGALGLVVRFADLPETQQKALDAGNQSGDAWRPSATELAALAGGWDGLPSRNPQLVKVKSEVIARDAFDRDFQSEGKTRDAKWAIRQVMDFHRSAAPTIRQIYVYAAMEAKDGGYAGNYTTTILAAAPFPIPITLNGSYQMYRLGGGADSGGGLWGRLMDVFRGCTGR